MPIYLVKAANNEYLVGAKNKAQATRHVAEKLITAEVASPMELVQKMQQGLQPENVSDAAE